MRRCFVKVSEQTFRWANGLDLNVTNWSDGEPNFDNPDDNCTVVTPENGWRHHPCTEKTRNITTVCERAVKSGTAGSFLFHNLYC